VTQNNDLNPKMDDVTTDHVYVLGLGKKGVVEWNRGGNA